MLESLRSGDWITRERVRFAAAALLIAFIAALAYLVATANGLNDALGRRRAALSPRPHGGAGPPPRPLPPRAPRDRAGPAGPGPPPTPAPRRKSRTGPAVAPPRAGFSCGVHQFRPRAQRLSHRRANR